MTGYTDMSDEHLCLLYEVNILRFLLNQIEINEETETTQSDEELIKEKKEIYEIITNAHDELEKRGIL